VTNRHSTRKQTVCIHSSQLKLEVLQARPACHLSNRHCEIDVGPAALFGIPLTVGFCSWLYFPSVLVQATSPARSRGLSLAETAEASVVNSSARLRLGKCSRCDGRGSVCAKAIGCARGTPRMHVAVVLATLAVGASENAGIFKGYWSERG